MYYPGVVDSIQGERVNVVFEDGDRISHSILDSSAVIPDKTPAFEVHMGQHVLALVPAASRRGSAKYFIGYVTSDKRADGGFAVTLDNNNEGYYPAWQLRLFPEQDSAYEGQ